MTVIVEEEEFQETPKPGTQLYQEIVKIGCGLHYDEWNGDYDCLHHYGWSCEECPVTRQAQLSLARLQERAEEEGWDDPDHW